ncbi:MAG: sigma-54-dependent Fis family transcriptional regulator [Planctomycetaceae bacterium]|nr:sigma-54-dependent Fis family transcriptional regulator [Planctomycetaceae bacterium]MBP61755.1 sigma-54-dependent Fis family transcriptional regulator [Planctomycetaceae bacterium]
MVAYLVIREGSKWTDVFRLIPGRTVTIGRAPTNQIVVKDERCSRHHAEIFLTQGRWTLRDLDSRNGTILEDKPVRGDVGLQPGDVILIAHAQLAFVDDLSAAFPESVTNKAARVGKEIEEETVGCAPDDANVLSALEPPTITHRKDQTKFLEQPLDEEDSTTPRVGKAATKLCRLAFELANRPDIHSVANLALSGLLESTQVDAGAVLLLPRDFEGAPEGSDLEIIASQAESEPVYHRISNFLATTVLREGEAVLARNVEDDSMLSVKDSKGELHATSTLCAPVRQGRIVVGLIHLYATSSAKVPDPDDLEFTLAVAENVALALKNLNRQQELAENLSVRQDEIVQLRERLGAESEIVGSSAPMGKVHQEVERAAPSRATVLIRGESGVGKELVARAVHYASPRRKGPFVCLNCAALSETLLESELFGHERGAFTGATERKIGKFEAAHDGTLMLDEIGEMSPSIQAKFLRVLEGHPFERVGGSDSIEVDVRVIAATNRDLEKDVSEGAFRRDLYFRLHVLEIRVPALRKRTSDVIELAHHFLHRFNIETGRRLRSFTPEALDHLQHYRWPGNVRELKNVIERAVVLAQAEEIEVSDLMLSNLATAGDTGEIPIAGQGYEPTTLAEMERRHIRATLQSTGGNKSRAASILGIERSTLDRKIRRYELNIDLPRRGNTA